MVDAPERIRVAQDSDGFWTCREAISGSQEYTRSDLVAELAAENERLKEKEAHRIKVIRENENLLYSNIELRRKIEALSRTGAVKALEWEDAVSALIGPDVYFSRASTVFGSYRTEQRLVGKWAMTTPNGDGICDEAGNLVHHNSLAEAKAAAQADYERRILSALVSHPCEPNPVVYHETANVGDEAPHLTEYEIQVLLGTSISGCNMRPDRVFSLDMAWHRLRALELIDRADGLAIITEKGQDVVARILSALTEPAGEAEPLSAQIERLASFIMEHVPGEPSQSEGAVDCAIRIIRNSLTTPPASAIREAVTMPELPDDDSDFTPDLARAIIAKYQEYIRRHSPPASAIREAAKRVIWFDWSENDPDAVAAIDGLRAALAGSAE